jgi:hypothetical protein
MSSVPPADAESGQLVRSRKDSFVFQQQWNRKKQFKTACQCAQQKLARCSSAAPQGCDHYTCVEHVSQYHSAMILQAISCLKGRAFRAALNRGERAFDQPVLLAHPQRRHRIDMRGSPRRQIPSKRSHRRENHQHPREGYRIARRNSKQKPAQRTRQHPRRDDPHNHSNASQPQRL